jgi:cell division protein YceG involved in septum cleavage
VRFILKSFAWILLAAVATAAGIALYAWQAFYAPGPAARSGNETIVLLEPGTGLNKIAEQLENAGVVRDKLFFRVGAYASGKSKDLKAGEYAIPSKASMDQVMAILVEGKSIMHKLTIPEGLTSAMIVKLLADDAVLIENPPAVPSEGTLMPETYLFLRGTTRQELLARMEKSHQEAVDDLWANRKADLPFKTKAEAVILASIVEKETGVADERPRVAAVFINRLRDLPRVFPSAAAFAKASWRKIPAITPTSSTDCRRRQLPIRAWRPSRLCSTHPTPKSSTSSPTAPAVTSLPKRSNSTTTTSPNGARSSATVRTNDHLT